MAVYVTNTSELKSIADAIRTKGETSGQLTFPTGFVSAIDNIVTYPSLQSKSVTPTESQQTITQDSGYYGLNQVVVAAISSTYLGSGITQKDAATYNTSSSNQTIAANQYLSGAQTIRGVTTANISAANIKTGIIVKVGDSADDDRIAGVTGTFTAASTITSGQTAAAAAQIRTGYSAFIDGAEVKGNIPNLATTTYNTSDTDQTISSGQYISGAQTIRAVTTTNLSAANVKYGVTVKVGDSADDDRISSVTGTFSGSTTITSGQTAAAAAQIRTGYSAFINGAEVKGSIANLAATTYNTSTSDQTIVSGKYISGTQTIKAVTTANISAENIKTGVTITVGDANSSTRIKNVAGTFTSSSTITSGQTAAAAAQIRTGYSAFINGAEVKGSIANLAAATYNTSTSDQTIATGKYISGTQTIKAVTTSNISAANIKTGVVIKVGDANSAGRIANVTGTFTSDATAAAADILSGKTAYVNGSKVTGSIASKAATTYNASTSAQTIAAGQYLSGAQTIRAITTSNIAAGNIKKGVTITVGDSGSSTRIANVAGTCVPFTAPPVGSGDTTVLPVCFESQTGKLSEASYSTIQYGYSSGKFTINPLGGHDCWFYVPCPQTWTITTSSGTVTKSMAVSTRYKFTRSGSLAPNLYQGSTSIATSISGIAISY